MDFSFLGYIRKGQPNRLPFMACPNHQHLTSCQLCRNVIVDLIEERLDASDLDDLDDTEEYDTDEGIAEDAMPELLGSPLHCKTRSLKNSNTTQPTQPQEQSRLEPSD